MTILLFIFVGVLIGTITNHIAIKMLFRPYKKWKILGFRIPLTPGLIPAQQEKLAEQIARSFEENFLSEKDLINSLKSGKIKGIIEEKIDDFLSSFGPVANMLEGLREKILKKVLAIIESIAHEITLSEDWSIYKKITSRINAMSAQELEKLVFGIAKKHFRYITIFGGILGGLIGTVQALFI